MRRPKVKPSASTLDKMLGEASWLLSYAEALTDYGREEEAAAELTRAASCEEQVACLLDAAGRDQEAGIHRVSAAACHEQLGQYARAVTLLRAALSATLPADYRRGVEQQLAHCLAQAHVGMRRSSPLRIGGRKNFGAAQNDPIVRHFALPVPAQPAASVGHKSEAVCPDTAARWNHPNSLKSCGLARLEGSLGLNHNLAAVVEGDFQFANDPLPQQAFTTQKDNTRQIRYVETNYFNSSAILLSYSPAPVSQASLDLKVWSSELTAKHLRKNEIAIKSGIKQCSEECTVVAYGNPYLEIRVIFADHRTPRLSLST